MNKPFKVGDIVQTSTTSGRLIECMILESGNTPGVWLLDSPRHGYLIQRAEWEMKLVEEKAS